MTNTLFDIENIDVKKEVVNPNTCLTCEHRERHQCGGSIIQYCAILKSNRTLNGQLKIKCKTPACFYYEPIKKV